MNKIRPLIIGFLSRNSRKLILTAVQILVSTHCTYLQVDGVSMGSPLRPLIANFYMAHIENKVLENLRSEAKAAIYSRYVDDMFVVESNVRQISELKAALTSSSVQTYTHELENKKLLSFLDVSLLWRGSRMNTLVHVKQANEGKCLNYHSICPERYINTFLSPAHKVCSIRKTFEREVMRISQLLTSNNNQTHYKWLHSKTVSLSKSASNFISCWSSKLLLQKPNAF